MNHHNHSEHETHFVHAKPRPASAYSLRNFLPLIIILSLIITATTIKQMLSPMTTAYNFMHDFMGIFFLVFGSFKLFNLKNFAEAYSTYDLIAQRSRTYALLYPFIELALGFAYLLHWYPLITLWITVVIMTISALGVLKALLKKEQFTCACLGVVFKIPMTYVTLLEDIAMAVMALVMVWMRMST